MITNYDNVYLVPVQKTCRSVLELANEGAIFGRTGMTCGAGKHWAMLERNLPPSCRTLPLNRHRILPTITVRSLMEISITDIANTKRYAVGC
jgi:hypothetical protein